jgi:adenylylsulfate kinase
MFRETHTRSIAKAVSWRILGTVATSLLVFLFTRKFILSLAIGATEFVTKIGLFWVHERLWDTIRLGRREPRPAVLWFTGLSASGKSSIASWVSDQLKRRGLKVEYLDGDALRGIFPATGFTRPEREQHIRRTGHLASKLEQQGVIVVASLVSPYRESREFVRRLCTTFVEIYVSTPLEECERRDPKGLYARARRGELSNFTGIDDPYEPPESPDLEFDTRTISVEQAGTKVLDLLRSHF